MNIGRNAADLSGPVGGRVSLEESRDIDLDSEGGSIEEGREDFDEEANDEAGSVAGEEDERDELDVMNSVAEVMIKDTKAFLPDHDQYITHQARMKKENPSIVPNFSPGD